MLIPRARYSELPAIWRACPCPKAARVYVAMSEGLNRRAVLGTASDKKLKPYVFKVGATKNHCHDRWRSLKQNRKPVEIDGRQVYQEPRYAGEEDWKFLKCWEVGTYPYDDLDFKPWLEQSSFRDDVKPIQRFSSPETPGMPSDKFFIDLFVMSEAYARSLCSTPVNDPLNEHILAVAANAIVLLVQEYVCSLPVKAA